MVTIAAMILAGGQSSRMGTDKALLTVKGQPMIRQVYDVADACSSQVYVVSPWGDRYRSVLPERCQFLQEPLTNGLSAGPLVAFYHGFSQIDADWVLLLACDLPNLQADVIQSWAVQLPHIHAPTMALLPKQAKGWDPLCGFYHRRCLPSLQDYLEQGRRSFQIWLNTQSVQALAIANTQMLWNCNTPTDLEQLNQST